MVSSPIPLLSATLLALQWSQTLAHSNMVEPKVTFPQGFYNGNSPFGRIDSDKFGTDIPSWKGVERAAAALNSTNSKTLRNFIMDNVKITNDRASKECGMALATGAKQPLPDAVNFPWGHQGPCEVWCDNARLFFDSNCQGNKVGKVPVDKTKCKGASFIQGMYIGVHVPNWEIYVNCAPIEGGSETDVTKALSARASGATSGDGEAANEAPTPTTSKPTGMPQAPVASSAAPAATTATPSKAPTPPKTPVSKCNVRRD